MGLRSIVAGALTVAALGSGAATAVADTHFMAVTGTDAGDCTSPAAPCRTFPYAQGQMAPEDRLEVAAGTYTPDHFPATNVIRRDITIAGPQAGVPVAWRVGPEAVIQLPASGTLFNMIGGGVTFDGLIISGSSTGRAILADISVAVRNTLIDGPRWGIVANAPLTLAGSEIRATEDAVLLGFGSTTTITASKLYGGSAAVRVGNGADLTATGNDLQGGQIGVHFEPIEPTGRLHGNRLRGGVYAVYSQSGAGIDAEDNWWGCNGGPGQPGCAAVGGSVDAAPYLRLTAEATPGFVERGGTATLSATLARNSADELTPYGTIPSLNATFAAQEGSVSPASVRTSAAGMSSTFTAPEDPGDVEWSVTLGDFTVTRDIGVADPARAELVPGGVHFGRVAVGESSPYAFELRNAGDRTLTVSDVELVGTNPGDFAVDDSDCAGTFVYAGESCELLVTFTPTALGDRQARVRITTDGVVPTIEGSVAGEGAVPGRATVSPGAIDFGDVFAGRQAAAQTVTVTNTGGTILTIQRLRGAKTGNTLFPISNDLCSGQPIAPEMSCTFRVAFAPYRAGEWSPQIEVLTDRAKAVLRLHGRALEAATLTPESVDFGNEVRGSTSDERLFALANPGDAAIGLSPQRIEGAGASQFRISSTTCAATLAAGSSCVVGVQFAPSQLGSSTPRLVAPTSAGVVTADLLGRGVRPLVARPTALDFGEVTRRTASAPQTVFVTNFERTRSIAVADVRRSGTGSSLFTVSDDDCSGEVLGPLQTCTFDVTFAPLAAGTWTPAVTVRAVSGEAAVVDLAGTGVR